MISPHRRGDEGHGVVAEDEFVSPALDLAAGHIKKFRLEAGPSRQDAGAPPFPCGVRRYVRGARTASKGSRLGDWTWNTNSVLAPLESIVCVPDRLP